MKYFTYFYNECTFNIRKQYNTSYNKDYLDY